MWVGQAEWSPGVQSSVEWVLLAGRCTIRLGRGRGRAALAGGRVAGGGVSVRMAWGIHAVGGRGVAWGHAWLHHHPCWRCTCSAEAILGHLVGRDDRRWRKLRPHGPRRRRARVLLAQLHLAHLLGLLGLPLHRLLVHACRAIPTHATVRTLPVHGWCTVRWCAIRLAWRVASGHECGHGLAWHGAMHGLTRRVSRHGLARHWGMHRLARH
mmetsp:Transcript_25545/g.64132  ORF Transcript_25545/g.64132 Transcript_25545/m.64132 type:complete len:211 (+) Transcript_25545:56-688(+)